MNSPILSKPTREMLYADETLGAGNFLFKAHALCSNGDVPFLFLERAFITPYGKVVNELSLNDLYRTVQELAHWYLASGVGRGSVVCTYTEEGASPFFHFLALNSVGAIPAPVNCQLAPELAAAYAERNGFDFFVFDGATNERTRIATHLTGKATGLNASLRGKEVNEAQPRPSWPVEKAHDDVVMICHSSGTTGVPKAVVFTHAQFFNGKRERLRSFIESSDEKMLSAFPQAHSSGMSYMMTSTMLGLPTRVLSVLTGNSVADHIRDFQPTIVLGFPRTFVSLLELNLARGSFNSVRRFYNTGDSAHESHIRSLTALAPGARLYDGFGASELGMSCFWKISTAESVTSRRCVGTAAPHATVKVVDAFGCEVAAGTIGYLCVKSSTITPGYYRMPHLSQLCRADDDYWQTGDVGYLDEEGSFYHLDRAADVVRSVGGPVYSLELEELLQQMPGVLDAHVVGVNRISSAEQCLVALIHSPPGASPNLDAILRTVAGYRPQLSGILPRFSLGVCLLNPAYNIPVGSTGKVLKRTLRESFWDWYREYDRGDRTAFSNVMWNDATVARA